MKKQNKQVFNFHQKLWFWIIIGVVVLGLIGSIDTSTDDCSQCKAELRVCQSNLADVSAAWGEYLEAFEDYCDIDYSNPLCTIL